MCAEEDKEKEEAEDFTIEVESDSEEKVYL